MQTLLAGPYWLPAGQQLYQCPGEVSPEDTAPAQLPETLQDKQGSSLTVLQPVLADPEP